MAQTGRKTSKLSQELHALVADQVLSADQAARLLQAAQADQGEPIGHRDTADSLEPPKSTTSPDEEPTPTTGALDVVGYLGGALMLGALIFVGFTLWGDLSRAGKTALAVSSLIVSAGGGLALMRSRTRRVLALTLLVLACVAAGFTCNVVFDDDDLIITTAVITVAAAIGALVFRAAAFYLPGWLGAMGLVVAVVVAPSGLNVVDGDPRAYAITGGFLLVAIVMVAFGLVLGRELAWTLAGLSGWAAAIQMVAIEHSYLALAVSIAVTCALFIGAVRLRPYAFATVGCLIVLSIWPVALYQILHTALGVALGLVAAGAVLITTAVLLDRRRRRSKSLN